MVGINKTRVLFTIQKSIYKSALHKAHHDKIKLSSVVENALVKYLQQKKN